MRGRAIHIHNYSRKISFTNSCKSTANAVTTRVQADFARSKNGKRGEHIAIFESKYARSHVIFSKVLTGYIA